VSDKNKSNLEFNDGLGDMLREKRSLTPNINRSLIVAISIIIVAVTVFSVAFKWGTRFLFKPQSNAVVVTNQIKSGSVDKENQALIKEMEALLAEASANVETPATPAAAVVPATAKPEAVKAPVPGKAIVAEKRPVPKKQIEPAPAPSKPLPPKAVVHVTPKLAPPVQHSGPLYRVFAGTFSTHAEATLTASQLKSAGYPVFVKNESGIFLVQVGAFGNTTVANSLTAELVRKGYKAYTMAP
jgi:cell division septation protein DedD